MKVKTVPRAKSGNTGFMSLRPSTYRNAIVSRTLTPNQNGSSHRGAGRSWCKVRPFDSLDIQRQYSWRRRFSRAPRPTRRGSCASSERRKKRAFQNNVSSVRRTGRLDRSQRGTIAAVFSRFKREKERQEIRTSPVYEPYRQICRASLPHPENSFPPLATLARAMDSLLLLCGRAACPTPEREQGPPSCAPNV
jgi:hypothetical protein